MKTSVLSDQFFYGQKWNNSRLYRGEPPFLVASSHLYKRVCPSVGLSVCLSVPRFFLATLANTEQLWATLGNSGQLWTTLRTHLLVNSWPCFYLFLMTQSNSSKLTRPRFDQYGRKMKFWGTVFFCPNSQELSNRCVSELPKSCPRVTQSCPDLH